MTTPFEAVSPKKVSRRGTMFMKKASMTSSMLLSSSAKEGGVEEKELWRDIKENNSSVIEKKLSVNS